MINNNNGLRVCERCFAGIKSREGDISSRVITTDPDDKTESTCGWCGDNGFDSLVEICGDTKG